MSYASSSDEVASDFLDALMSLNMNNRYEISNLTVIAKENTEAAYAISEALKNHIKQTSPQKKLPAFYVLDSIVKNVGTPYTLFFGRQLYQTFMEAYALMDTNTRKKMDEMLKTWKEPVPGSMDQRPVFPPDITRPIENALIKARTSALEAHQQYQRSQPQMGRGRSIVSPAPYRDTSTPPGLPGAVRQPMNAPLGYASNYPQPQYPPPQSYAPPATYTAPPQQYAPPLQYAAPVPYPNAQPYPPSQPYPYQMNGQQQQNYGPPQRLPSQQYSQQPPDTIAWQQSQSQGYHAPDHSVDTLKNDIENLITSSKLDFGRNPTDADIQTRLKALLALQNLLTSQRLPPDQIVLIKDQVAKLSQAARPSPRNPTPPPPSLSSLLGPGALEALRAAIPPKPTPQPEAPPETSALQLLEKLRAAGMLKDATPVPTGFPPPLPFTNTPPTSRTPLAEIPNDVELTIRSLKMPRPHLIYSLYEKLGTPCNQCGRRFKTDDEGKKKKTAHMDWHFSVNQRMAEDRGQHRSWYLNVWDWIKFREVDDAQAGKKQDDNNGSGTTSGGPEKPKIPYVPVPLDIDVQLANKTCPICQDQFKQEYLADEWVWMDAKIVGEKYYHASCYGELQKNSSIAMRGTPDPVLGKRKAEDELLTMRTKIKPEPPEY